MHLVEVESTFDASKLIFQFTAEHRVDFRELVRDLAGRFRTRIELRQIGVRDEAKLLGGIGMCGRELCCSTWMTEFMPVSIRMAKDQNLSLNPAKISGVCGRLLCCLRFELDPDAKGKSHQQLAAEPSLADLELVQALQEDMLAAVESAPTRDETFAAVSMPRPVRAPQPAQPLQQPPQTRPKPPQSAQPAEAAETPRETSRESRPGPARLPRPGSAPVLRQSQSPHPADLATPDTGSEPEPTTAPGQGRSRRRRRGRRGGADSSAGTPGNGTGEQQRQRPRRRSRRGPARPGGQGGTSRPGGSAGPTSE